MFRVLALLALLAVTSCAHQQIPASAEYSRGQATVKIIDAYSDHGFRIRSKWVHVPWQIYCPTYIYVRIDNGTQLLDEDQSCNVPTPKPRFKYDNAITARNIDEIMRLAFDPQPDAELILAAIVKALK